MREQKIWKWTGSISERVRGAEKKRARDNEREIKYEEEVERGREVEGRGRERNILERTPEFKRKGVREEEFEVGIMRGGTGVGTRVRGSERKLEWKGACECERDAESTQVKGKRERKKDTNRERGGDRKRERKRGKKK